VIRLKGKRPRGHLRRATAVVELAVVSPLLFAMLFGIIEFGWLFTVQHTMVNAAREGARLGVLQGADMIEVEAETRQFLAPMGLESQVSVEISEATVDDPFVRVRLWMPREDVSLVGNFFGFSGGTVEGAATMRKEGM